MNWFVSALTAGVIAFSATNLDDILFLIFFSLRLPVNGKSLLASI